MKSQNLYGRPLFPQPVLRLIEALPFKTVIFVPDATRKAEVERQTEEHNRSDIVIEISRICGSRPSVVIYDEFAEPIVVC